MQTRTQTKVDAERGKKKREREVWGLVENKIREEQEFQVSVYGRNPSIGWRPSHSLHLKASEKSKDHDGAAGQEGKQAEKATR